MEIKTLINKILLETDLSETNCKRIWCACCSSGWVRDYRMETEAEILSQIGSRKAEQYIKWRSEYEEEDRKVLRRVALEMIKRRERDEKKDEQKRARWEEVRESARIHRLPRGL